MDFEQHSAWELFLDELSGLHRFMDLFTAAWCTEYRASGGNIPCTSGCYGCCSLAVNCTFGEAVAITASLDSLQAAHVASHAGKLKILAEETNDLKSFLRDHRRTAGWCPFLDSQKGCCSVYAVRPLACRALISTLECRWCSVDFASLPAGEKRAYLDSIDSGAAAYPLHYARVPQETGRELEERCLTMMHDSLGFSLYGSLPVLVHLVADHGLAAAGSVGAVYEILKKSGFTHPLLTNLNEAGS